MPRVDEFNFVFVEKALEAVDHVLRTTEGLRPTDEQAMALLTASCPIYETDSGDAYKEDELINFIHNLTGAISNRDSSYLEMKRGLRVPVVVDIEEFCMSRQYLNQGEAMRPVVLKGLIELFRNSEQYIECVLSGSIGWGKTYFSYAAVAYMIYRLSCFYNPQLEYGLAPGSSIVFIQQSQKYELAKKVVFDQLLAMLRLSPYFKEVYQFDPNIKSELRFPENIIVLPVGGSETAAIGMNVFGGVIDEMNFMARVKHSEVTRFTGGAEYDQAEQVYRSLIRRMKSRFMQRGKVPGKLLLISSVNYAGDFTDRKIQEAKTDPTILPLSYAQWDALPADKFCGEKFLVEVGSAERRSRIIKDKSQALHEEDILEVPTEYLTDFQRDIEAALKDYAGRATSVKRPFIPFREEMHNCIEIYVKTNGRTNLFRHDECIISELIDQHAGDYASLVDMDFFDDMYMGKDVAFAMHVDVGLNGDAAGLALGHIAGYKLLAAGTYFDSRSQQFITIKDMRAPIYMIDGALRLIAPSYGEVELEYIQQLMLFFRERLNLKYFTADWYQSAQLIQAARRVKVKSGRLSVDTSPEPYTEVKLAIKDERILLPRHEVMIRELQELERDPEEDKIDHPSGGSKDVSDGVAGVVHVLQRKEAKYGLGQRVRPSREQARDEATEGEEPVRQIRMGDRGQGGIVRRLGRS